MKVSVFGEGERFILRSSAVIEEEERARVKCPWFTTASRKEQKPFWMPSILSLAV